MLKCSHYTSTFGSTSNIFISNGYCNNFSILATYFNTCLLYGSYEIDKETDEIISTFDKKVIEDLPIDIFEQCIEYKRSKLFIEKKKALLHIISKLDGKCTSTAYDKYNEKLSFLFKDKDTYVYFGEQINAWRHYDNGEKATGREKKYWNEIHDQENNNEFIALNSMYYFTIMFLGFIKEENLW